MSPLFWIAIRHALFVAMIDVVIFSPFIIYASWRYSKPQKDKS